MTVRRRPNNLRVPEDNYASLSNIMEIIKIVDLLVLNSILYVIDDSQINFIERCAFTTEDLISYRKLCQKDFAENLKITDKDNIDLKKLTVECVLSAKL